MSKLSKLGLLCALSALLARRSSLERLPECPGFGTDVDDGLCALWRESVASIPYEVPWTEDNQAQLRDSMMVHCSEAGVVKGRLCCSSFDEWSCRTFSPDRARHILDAIAPPSLSGLDASFHRTGAPDTRPPPALVLAVGLPGTGKSASLLPLAKALLSEHTQPASQPVTLPSPGDADHGHQFRGGAASVASHDGQAQTGKGQDSAHAGVGDAWLQLGRQIRSVAADADVFWSNGWQDTAHTADTGAAGHGRQVVDVIPDDLKLLLARDFVDRRSGGGSRWDAAREQDLAGAGAEGLWDDSGPEAPGEAPTSAPDDLCRRVALLNAAANESRPLVHSQYLHRESIYLADEQFKRGAASRAHIVMEKIMASYSQVAPYISALRNATNAAHGHDKPQSSRPQAGLALGGDGTGALEEDGGRKQRHAGASDVDDADVSKIGIAASSPEGPDARVQGCASAHSRGAYRVVILATSADLERCKRGNKVRRRSGHVITQLQLEAQHSRYTKTVADLAARLEEAVKGKGISADLAGMGLVVINTNSFLDELVRGVPLAAAAHALVIDYARFIAL